MKVVVSLPEAKRGFLRSAVRKLMLWPTPRMWMAASAAMRAMATNVCGENVSGTNGIGITNNGVVEDAPGTNRPR